MVGAPRIQEPCQNRSKPKIVATSAMRAVGSDAFRLLHCVLTAFRPESLATREALHTKSKCH